MNEMIGRMMGDNTIVLGSALVDFLTVVLCALIIFLFAKYVIPYARK